MEQTPRKKRRFWIDMALITGIFILVGFIVSFIITDSEAKSFHSEMTTPGTMVDSNITEETSAFPGIRIVSDISNEPALPFAIQYPQTDDENFNSIIEEYITSSKKAYINGMRPKKTEDMAQALFGELNIDFDTYQHDEAYYSFVFTERVSTNAKETNTAIKTFFYNIETREFLDIRTLLDENVKSLETFSSHVRELVKSNPSLQQVIWEEEVNLATEPRWILFERFAIKDEELYIYFDEGTVAPAEEGPISVNIPLSFLNPLLSPEFQKQMVNAEEAPVKPGDDYKKRVALTFDDGPHPRVTKQILECLERYKAKATFFMLGNRVQYYPEVAAEVKAYGHEIGNHTWSHPVLPKLTETQLMSEFTTTEQAILDATGQKSTVFRPPYGATNEAINQKIPHNVVLWSIDTLDWKHRNAEKLVAQVKQHMHNNAIILMHDIHQSTADGLPVILEFLSKEGYEFVTVSEILPYR
ncbi:MAG: polysaccharide deacetylase family protein [Lysinibacillus sp.]